jgi:acyl-CoA synthetase (AMP-forming)/AMP-acid ligase II
MSRAPFRSLAGILTYRAGHEPSGTACAFLSRDHPDEPESALTYEALDSRSRRIAVALRQLGASRALVLYPPGLDFVAAFFGCLYAGVTAVPAPVPRWGRSGRTLERTRWIASDASVQVVLTTADTLDRIHPWLRTSEAGELSGIRWLATDSLVEGPAGHDAIGFDPASLEDVAFLQYTSGSTRDPRGVMVTHRNLMHNLDYANRVESNDADSVSVSWLPHFHDMGLIEGILLPVFAGYPAYLMSPASCLQRPARWLQAISQLGATNSGGPNFIYELCARKLNAAEIDGLDLGRWRVAYNGAEMVRPTTLARFAERFARCGFRTRAFYPVYGLAESTLVVTSPGPRDVPVVEEFDADGLGRGEVLPPGSRSRARALVGCGRASCRVEVAIVDPETRLRSSPRQVGEIWVRGPSVTAGYWSRPEESRTRFVNYIADSGEGPFLRTGDLGFVRNGILFVAGRLKEMILVRGLNHYPHEIERAVEACHHAVRPASVAAFPVESEHAEGLGVALELDPRAEKQSRTGRRESFYGDLIASVQQALAKSSGLSADSISILKAGALPRTSSGKLRRGTCAEYQVRDGWRALHEWRRSVSREVPA